MHVRTPKYIKLTLTYLKGEIDRNTIIIAYFNSSLSIMDNSSRKKINKDTIVLNNAINKMDLTNTEHLAQQQQNIHSFQAYMEHSLE